MSITATRTPEELNARKDYLAAFLIEQGNNDLLPLDRRDDYALAGEILDNSTWEDLDEWPAARALIARMTEGLL